MGETCAVCQSVGTTPVSKDLLKMSNSVGEMLSASSFNMLSGKPILISMTNHFPFGGWSA
jgi:hypothetical protein